MRRVYSLQLRVFSLKRKERFVGEERDLTQSALRGTEFAEEKSPRPTRKVGVLGTRRVTGDWCEDSENRKWGEEREK
jgi:hypothetical protein